MIIPIMNFVFELLLCILIKFLFFFIIIMIIIYTNIKPSMNKLLKTIVKTRYNILEIWSMMKLPLEMMMMLRIERNIITILLRKIKLHYGMV